MTPPSSEPLMIDLYGGLGGWAEGGLSEGYRVVGFDLERHVYGEARYPAQLVLQDVLTLHGRQFKDAALIVASPPCQAFSMAGKRVGLGGDRSVLWFEFHRIVSELRPRWVVVENVFGARSFPADFATILTGLSDLGYGVAWRELDAQFIRLPAERELPPRTEPLPHNPGARDLPEHLRVNMPSGKLRDMHQFNG